MLDRSLQVHRFLVSSDSTVDKENTQTGIFKKV